MPGELLPGLYEQVISEALRERLARLAPGLVPMLAKLDTNESHLVLSQYVAGVLVQRLRRIVGDDRLERQVAYCNALLTARLEGVEEGDAAYAVATPAQQLLQVGKLGVSTPPRPDTPLSVGSLLTATGGDPSLASQVKQEILSADRVDILVSFVKWSGIRIIKDELQTLTRTRPLRVITTSYMGATDLKAVQFLLGLPNTEVWVSFDTKRTRLHAKAFLFHRDTDYSTAYVGSSNISNPAMTDGLEWNVKICEVDSPHLWQKAKAAFDTYRQSKDFEKVAVDGLSRLGDALSEERAHRPDQEDRHLTFFEIRPFPYQQEILDKLQAEREIHGRQKNLVVAATGTGKTVVAAFDFKRCFPIPRDARVLFVAHREEILKQSRDTFRQVLKDQNFGELLVGQHEANHWEQLFLSIQTFNTQRFWEQLPADFYDYIVIDEFHRAAAPSYQRLIAHFRPKVLLGLTATPERTDEQDVLRYFDGRIAAEIRLPDAVNRKLLSPFQYFCITDTVDYSEIAWKRGAYDQQALDGVLTGNDARAMLIADKIEELLLDVSMARGLCFCVSQRHAEFMADRLARRGIRATALTANTPNEERRRAITSLQGRETNFLCVVDLFNEGVDIPEVDTVLFLRPTESLTVFLQQLGRGLRLCEGKDCLTVLDFVGHAHRRFDFEGRFRALLSRSPRRIEDEITHSFPSLPAGCVIEMEKVAQQHVLENIKSNLRRANRNEFVQRIKEYAEDTGEQVALAGFLERYGIAPDDLYRRGSWSRLCVLAGVGEAFQSPDEETLTKGLRRFCHQDSAPQLLRLGELLLQDMTASDAVVGLEAAARRLLTMLCYSVWNGNPPEASLAANVVRLARNHELFSELRELVGYLQDRADTVVLEPELPFPCPLSIHASYTRDEILAGLGYWSIESRRPMRQGVVYLEDIKTDVFLITLNKSDKDYSPTTMYEDYAIDEALFHWQSQSTTSETSPTGQRYIGHKAAGSHVLLFVREDKDRNGLAMPYSFLGPADYVSHTGSRPMSIIWRLRHPMPAKLIRNTVRMGVA